MATILSDKVWKAHETLGLSKYLNEMDHWGLAKQGLFSFWTPSTYDEPVSTDIAHLPAALLLSIGMEIASALVNFVGFMVSIFDNAIPSIFTDQSMKERSEYEVTTEDYGIQSLSGVGYALLHTLLLIPTTIACVFAFSANKAITSVAECCAPRAEII